MAFGKHYRHEKQASSFCFKGTMVIILGLCVLAVWMMNSSSPVPAERKSFSTVIKPRTETKEKANDSVTFEDNPGDLPDDAIKGDDGDPEKRPEIEQKSELHKTSDGNEEKISDENEEKQSGNEEKTPDENDENTSVRDEQNSEEGVNSNEGKPIERSENDNDKVIVNEDNEKLTEPGDNEAGSQEEDAQNNSQSGKDGGSGAGGNEESEVREDGEKNEGEAGNDRKQEPGIEEKVQDPKLSESLPNGGQFELLKENTVEPGKWGTQDAESRDEKEREEIDAVPDSKDEKESSESQGQIAEEPSSFNESGKQLEDKEKSLKESKKKNKEQFNENIGYPINWQLCNVTAGADYIPCLDNEEAIRKLRSTKHYEHRERHCPKGPLTCLVPLPKGYRWPIHWPESRDKIWYNNVPHTKLAIVKGHQNWVKVSGEYLTFPGGGTQFKNGALHYIDFIEETIPDVAWGKHSRVILDVGCGVASFGGFLFEREVLTMSFAPKDEHEAQIQLALERGIPAISAVMGTQRLPFPSAVFDIVHCARCRVPWHADGGKLLLELNRLLRPGGYFVWSATPIYQNLEVDVAIWEAMSSLTTSICWNLLAKKVDPVNEIGVAIYQKPTSNICYESRRQNEPPLCEEGDDPNAAWYVPMNSCLHRVPTGDDEHGTEWPEAWPQRLEKVPSWLDNNLHAGFMSDTKHWKHIVDKSYLTGLGIDWSAVRNVMDMKAAYGGFAAALASQPVWVMNVVPTDAPSTLPVIYERGLFGIYHDWCESFNTYPRTYDLLHADHLFSGLQQRCTLVSVMTEVDRILRPGGSIIFRDKVETLNELEALVKSLHWQIRMTFSQQQEGIICAQKTMWRPQTVS